MAHPIAGNHQHAKSGKVYNYHAEYRTEDGTIYWHGEVTLEGELRLEPQGIIPAGTPAADTIAPSAVTDAVIKAIDQIGDGATAL